MYKNGAAGRYYIQFTINNEKDHKLLITRHIYLWSWNSNAKFDDTTTIPLSRLHVILTHDVENSTREKAHVLREIFDHSHSSIV